VLWWVDREALGETVESGFRTGVELLGARRACLYLRNSEKDSMVSVASLNHDPLSSDDEQAPWDGSLMRLSAARAAAFVGLRHGVTFVSAPLLHDGNVVGVLNLSERDAANAFGQEHLAAAKGVAAHLALLLGHQPATSLAGQRTLSREARFLDLLEREVARSKRSGTPFAMAWLYIKEDRPSHQVQLMRAVEQGLVDMLRRYDTLCQVGDLEFGLIVSMPGQHSRSVLQRIRAAIGSHVEQMDMMATWELASAECPRDGLLAADLVAHSRSSVYDRVRVTG